MIFVMPEIAVETAIGWVVRVAILQGEDLGNLRERLTGKWERLGHRPRRTASSASSIWAPRPFSYSSPFDAQLNVLESSFRFTATISATTPKIQSCTPTQDQDRRENEARHARPRSDVLLEENEPAHAEGEADRKGQ